MAHYSQQYKGKPLTILKRQHHGLTPKVRFMKYVRINTDTGCWEWLGGKNDKGYGTFVLTMDGRTGSMLAHRAAWLLFHGPIPVDERHKYKTYGVLHHCDNKACVAPAHLFLGTQRDNALDAIRKHGHWGNGDVHGEACSWRKLSAEQVQAIWFSTAPERRLAAQYGVSHGTIGDIKRRRSWRHVTEGLTMANTILTTRMAGIIGDPSMAETPPTSDAWPGYWFHPTLPMVLCENEAEAKALPPGYRSTPYTEEEADAWTKAQAAVQEEAEEPHTRRSHR